jgi:Uma2 family endonuclease
VRFPDVSFISWEQIGGDVFPEHAIARLYPDLAVEVTSKGNTKKEIARKLREYFAAGTRLAWVINPRTKTADVYTSPTDFKRLGKGQALDGGDVLPGFRLSLAQVFARATRRRRSR